VESDVGTQCGLFEIRKIGDDYFTFFEECKNPSACSIILRGGSKDSLNEMERNFHDAIGVARNLYKFPRLLPGGGAIEMELSHRLTQRATNVEGIEQLPYKALALALEIIPRTLAENCGCDVIRSITELRGKHGKEGGMFWGINGETGEIGCMKSIGVWEPMAVKSQTVQTAIECACMLLRIDDVVSGIQREKGGSKPGPVQQQPETVSGGFSNG